MKLPCEIWAHHKQRVFSVHNSSIMQDLQDDISELSSIPPYSSSHRSSPPIQVDYLSDISSKLRHPIRPSLAMDETEYGLGWMLGTDRGCGVRPDGCFR